MYVCTRGQVRADCCLVSLESRQADRQTEEEEEEDKLNRLLRPEAAATVAAKTAFLAASPGALTYIVRAGFSRQADAKSSV